MRIVFMGTPDFAVPCLQALLQQAYEVVGVFTQPDKPKGRGYKMIPPPVKAAAVEAGLSVYQPLSLRKGEEAEQAMQTLQELAPDVIVVVAYGQILPKAVLDLPKYGCINIHGSLLPAYRGAAPMQMCLLNGETETGVTSMQMAEGLVSPSLRGVEYFVSPGFLLSRHFCISSSEREMPAGAPSTTTPTPSP